MSSLNLACANEVLVRMMRVGYKKDRVTRSQGAGAIIVINNTDVRVTSEGFSLEQLHDFYVDQLLNHIMPFWMTNCIDVEHGGINNIVQDDGAVLSTDKILWSQGRALWTFSALYNYFDQDKKWLDVADGIAKLLTRCGRDQASAWFLNFTRTAGWTNRTRAFTSMDSRSMD